MQFTAGNSGILVPVVKAKPKEVPYGLIHVEEGWYRAFDLCECCPGCTRTRGMQRRVDDSNPEYRCTDCGWEGGWQD